MAPMDYINILKRRKWSLILPALIVLLIAIVVALAPAVYLHVDLHHFDRGTGHSGGFCDEHGDELR